jgi:uncharacterized protein YktA (UPF0223 family)
MKFIIKKNFSSKFIIFFWIYVLVQSVVASPLNDEEEPTFQGRLLREVPDEIAHKILNYLYEPSLLYLREINKETELYVRGFLFEDYKRYNLQTSTDNDSKSSDKDQVPTNSHWKTQSIPKLFRVNFKVIKNLGLLLWLNNSSGESPDDSKIHELHFLHTRITASYHQNRNWKHLLASYSRYLKLWNKFEAKNLNNSSIKEALHQEKRFCDSLIRKTQIMWNQSSNLTYDEKILYAKLFVNGNQMDNVVPILSPWLAGEIHEIPLEVQFLSYKLRNNSFIMDVFSEEHSGVKHYQPFKKYKILKAIVQTKSELKEQKKIKHKAEFHLAKIFHLIQSHTSQNVVNDPFKFETNKSSFINISPPDSMIDLKKTWESQDNIKYTKNFIRSLYRNNLVVHDGGLILNEHITIGSPTFGSSSTLTINTGFLKINGSVTINYGSTLTLNAAFVSIDGNINGGGELILNDKRLNCTNPFRERLSDEIYLRENFDPWEWYDKSARGGYKKAQFLLGLMYTQGNGVIKDEAKAVKWYIKAADQGHMNAQYNLGIMYATGQGVIQNKIDAILWFKKAAQQGHEKAQQALLSSILYK